MNRFLKLSSGEKDRGVF